MLATLLELRRISYHSSNPILSNDMCNLAQVRGFVGVATRLCTRMYGLVGAGYFACILLYIFSALRDVDYICW